MSISRAGSSSRPETTYCQHPQYGLRNAHSIQDDEGTDSNEQSLVAGVWKALFAIGRWGVERLTPLRFIPFRFFVPIGCDAARM